MNTLVIMFYLLILLMAFYVAFTRQFNNLYYLLFRSNAFVVVHILKIATRKPVVYFAIPNVKDKFVTHIFGKNSYDLHPEDANFTYKNRKHYIFNEEDFMPLKAKKINIVSRILKGKQYEVDEEALQLKEKPGTKTTILEDDQVVFVYQGKVYYNSNNECQPVKIDPRVADDYVWGSARVEQGMTAKSHRVLHGQESQLLLLIAGIALIIVIAIAVWAVITIQNAQPLLDVIYAKVQPTNITINGR